MGRKHSRGKEIEKKTAKSRVWGKKDHFMLGKTRTIL